MKNNSITQSALVSFGNKFTFGSTAVLTLMFALSLFGTAHAQDHNKNNKKMHGNAHHMMRMDLIRTQAQAEALKPGDSMAMICSKCKYVIVHKVTADKTHVEMMTVGEKMKCVACDGDVVVATTGEGEGKHTVVKHVCSNCGDDAMFCAATKAGSGTMKDKEHGEHKKDGKHKRHE